MNVRMGAEHEGTRLMERAAWMLAAVLAGLCLVSIYHQPVGWGPLLVVTALALGAACRPYDALLVLADARGLSRLPHARSPRGGVASTGRLPIARLTRPGRLGTVRCDARRDRSAGVGGARPENVPSANGASAPC